MVKKTGRTLRQGILLSLCLRAASSYCRFQATTLIREMEQKANAQATVEGKGASEGEWHIPILAMTADVIHATLEKCLEIGMDGYVSKPFQEKSLYEAVAEFFEPKPTTNSDHES